MTNRTETCTPAERAFLDALMPSIEDLGRCPYCDYNGMGPQSDAIEEAHMAILRERAEVSS